MFSLNSVPKYPSLLAIPKITEFISQIHNYYKVRKNSNQIKSNLLKAEGPSWLLALP